MPPSPEPQPLAVDYSGRPLTEDDTVAFVGTDPVCLRQGRIRVIGPHDLCIESGAQLVVFSGTHAGWAEQAARPFGGKTVPNEDLAHVRAYPHVALQAPADQSVVLDETVRRHKGAIVRVDELLAVIERVRAFAARLEEFGENVLKDDDRKLYAAIAKDLRARIDGPPPGLEAPGDSEDGVPPVREQRERPTHADGTPYRYHEIVAEGWEFCEGCHMWSTATPDHPHQCQETHVRGPVQGGS